MKFYRVGGTTISNGSHGFSWYTARGAAEKDAAAFVRDHTEGDQKPDRPKVEEVNIKPTRAGILAALTRYASRPDNG